MAGVRVHGGPRGIGAGTSDRLKLFGVVQACHGNQPCPGDGGVPGAAWVCRSRRSDLLFSCDPSSAVASSSSWTSSASEILLGGVLDHLRGGGVAAIRVGAGTAQIRRVFGEILNINSHGGSGELPISAVALLAVVERGLYCSQSAQNLARRAAAP